MSIKIIRYGKKIVNNGDKKISGMYLIYLNEYFNK
jgi:hypothetical protein